MRQGGTIRSVIKKRRVTVLLQLFFILLFIPKGHSIELPPAFVGSFGSLNPAEMYPVDIAVDSEKNIYVLDELNRRVHKRAPDNTLLLLFGSNGKDDGQFYFPRGIALDSEGKIYVTDCIANRVQKFDIDGAFILKWGESGVSDGQFGYPTGIAISPSGLVYVTDRFNSRIQVFDINGTFLFKWGADEILLAPEYIAIDSNNNVWVTDIGAHQVIKYDEKGNYILSFGSWGVSPGEFKSPTGITIDGNDYVYVYDRWNFRVQKFDQDGNFVEQWGEPGHEDGQLHGLGMASDNDSSIYIADYWNYRAQKFSSQGEFLYKWTGTITGDGEFAYVHDLVVSHSGDVYVTDRYNQNVQVFDNSGNFLFKWGLRGEARWKGPYFNFPRAITVDSQDNVYISNDNDIRIFDADGIFLEYWLVRSDEVPFIGPLGIIADNNDNIFFTGTDHQVVKTDKDGNILMSWGTYGTNYGQFNTPSGIGVDSTGNVYVSDMFNCRIQKFSNDGDFLATWGSRGYDDGLFIKPMGLAIDHKDNVYVVDVIKSQVQKFDVNGNFLTKWGQLGTEDGEFHRPHYIAIDDSGMNIFVTDRGNGRVQKFSYITISLTPDVTSVSRGGTLGIEIAVTNYTNESQTVKFGANVTLPNGNLYPSPPALLLRTLWITLAPYETKTEHITHDVPIDAPVGRYVYHGYLGKGRWNVWNENLVEFSVTP